MFSILIKRLPLLAFLFIATQLYGQNFTGITTEFREGKVYVNFNVDGEFSNTRYKVSVYSSNDNFQSPLREISGDIADGKEITQSIGPFQFVWDAQRELREYEGNLQLELRGEVTYVPIHSTQQISAKQTKPTNLLWDGGNPQDQVKIDLIQYGEVKKEIDQVPNNGRYTWQVTKEIDKGDYKLRYTNLGNSGEVYETATFKVGKKGSPLAIIIPVAVLGAGGGAYILFGPDDSGGPGGEETVDSLPNAIDPPN